MKGGENMIWAITFIVFSAILMDGILIVRKAPTKIRIAGAALVIAILALGYNLMTML